MLNILNQIKKINIPSSYYNITNKILFIKKNSIHNINLILYVKPIFFFFFSNFFQIYSTSTVYFSNSITIKTHYISKFIKNINIISYTFKKKKSNLLVQHKQLTLRHPIVAVVGHVNHGKTTFLDTIRNTNVAQNEFDNITQHISAYNVITNFGNITFIDTPGHFVFDAIRTLSIECADIVLLLIAVNDGVKQQTIEAIDLIKKKKKTPIIVLNKCDIKENFEKNVSQIFNILMKYCIFSEKCGGDVLTTYISAKNKTGFDEILYNIQLQAEMLELYVNLSLYGNGIILETKIDKGLGIIITVIVLNGLLKKGTIFISDNIIGKIRSLQNINGHEINNVKPSYSCEIIGLKQQPKNGAFFTTKKYDKTIKKHIKNTTPEVYNTSTHNDIEEKKVYTNTINIILKTDVFGTIDAIYKSIQQLCDTDLNINILKHGIGDINESDLFYSNLHGAIIIGFNVKILSDLKKKNINTKQTEIYIFNSIYKIVNFLKKKKITLEKTINSYNIIGSAIVKTTFLTKEKCIAGCFMEKGIIKKNHKINIIRNDELIHTDIIKSLKCLKKDTLEVHTQMEFGIVLKNFNNFMKNDVLNSFE